MKPGAVGKRYRDLQRVRYERLHALGATPDMPRGFDAQKTHFDAGDGAEDEWIFSNPQDNEWPTQAVQVIDRSTADAYAVTVRLHCEDDAASCAALRDDASHLPLPRPQQTYVADGRVLRTMSYRQWQDWVLKEPCNPGADYRPTPRYPSAALRRASAGRVVATFLINPCGKVRDAWVAQSSGNRDIDRAAIQTLMTWRIHGAKPGYARIPITFAIDEPPAPTE